MANATIVEVLRRRSMPGRRLPRWRHEQGVAECRALPLGSAQTWGFERDGEGELMSAVTTAAVCSARTILTSRAAV